jgi:hypothetical protein
MLTSAPRIALIHATALAVEPIAQAFERHWPQARRMNLLDDSPSVDREQHHEKIAEAARQFADCAVVMLAQFSMADAQPVVQQQLSCPVLSSPDCAVLALQKRMADV